MRRIFARRRRWAAAAVIAFVGSAGVATVLARETGVALLVGLAASGWAISINALRQPVADLLARVDITARGGEELLAIRVVSRGVLPTVVANAALASDRTVGAAWWPTWHALHSELPGRPLHHGEAATFCVSLHLVTEKMRDLNWVRVEDTTGHVTWTPVPEYVRERLAAIRATGRRLARYRVEGSSELTAAPSRRAGSLAGGLGTPQADDRIQPVDSGRDRPPRRARRYSTRPTATSRKKESAS
jgi:hypothetical protein